MSVRLALIFLFEFVSSLVNILIGEKEIKRHRTTKSINFMSLKMAFKIACSSSSSRQSLPFASFVLCPQGTVLLDCLITLQLAQGVWLPCRKRTKVNRYTRISITITLCMLGSRGSWTRNTKYWSPQEKRCSPGLFHYHHHHHRHQHHHRRRGRHHHHHSLQ